MPAPRLQAIALTVVLAGGGHGLAAAEDWPQWRGAGRLGVWHEDGIVEQFPDGGLQVAWRTPLGSGYAGPAVADGRVFRSGDRSQGLSFARAARRAVELGGRYDGHELPEDINAMTVASATALAGDRRWRPRVDRLRYRTPSRCRCRTG